MSAISDRYRGSRPEDQPLYLQADVLDGAVVQELSAVSVDRDGR